SGSARRRCWTRAKRPSKPRRMSTASGQYHSLTLGGTVSTGGPPARRRARGRSRGRSRGQGAGRRRRGEEPPRARPPGGGGGGQAVRRGGRPVRLAGGGGGARRRGRGRTRLPWRRRRR